MWISLCQLLCSSFVSLRQRFVESWIFILHIVTLLWFFYHIFQKEICPYFALKIMFGKQCLSGTFRVYQNVFILILLINKQYSTTPYSKGEKIWKTQTLPIPGAKGGGGAWSDHSAKRKSSNCCKTSL